ncbi:hypothetical protein TYRP_020192 [Tyrophagus putrescentiae]|nr:hypothetical protein TYRP_020192 [Tyrophagus putrescentiae]
MFGGINVTSLGLSVHSGGELSAKAEPTRASSVLKPRESRGGREKIIALDSSGTIITFNSIISYFEYWFAESLLLLCTSGTSKNEVVKKWKQQLGRPGPPDHNHVLAEEDEELESDDGGSSNLMSDQSIYEQSTYDQSTYDQSTYGDTASQSQGQREGGGESGETWQMR